MQPLSLLAFLGVAWALLQLWLVPLVKARWKGEDLRGKMARAGVLVVVEKLRDLAAAGTCAVAAVVLLVAAANLLGGTGVVWPKAVIAAAGQAYGAAKSVADGYGSALSLLGFFAAAVVLWFAARNARRRVSEVWVQRANATYKAIVEEPSRIDAVREDAELLPIVQRIDAAIAAIQSQERVEQPDSVLAEQAQKALGQALSHLSIEMARKEVDFPGAVSQPAAGEAVEPPSKGRRLLNVLFSKKLGEDLGLVRKPVGWVVTGLLFVSLMGWAAEPLANSLQLAVNNLRVELAQAEAQQQLDLALSRADEEPRADRPAPSANDSATAARLLSRAFVQEMARAPLLASGGSGGRRGFRAEANLARALLAEQHLNVEPDAAPSIRVRAEAAQAAGKAEVPSAGLRHAEESLQASLHEMQQSQPLRMASLVQRLEARYSAPSSPLDAQGKLTAKLLDEVFAAVDVNPGDELGKQAQKLSKDFGKDAVKTWANGALKQFLADTLAGVARPEVQRAFAFEMSNESRAFLEALQASEGRGWQAGGAASREARMAAKVAEQVADLHPARERDAIRELLGGYERLFPVEDAPLPHSPGLDLPTMPGGGGGGGGGGGNPSGGSPHHAQARATNFHVASRSFRVRGVLVGQVMEGEAIDATDLRWKFVPGAQAGAATRVALEMRIASSGRDLPAWQAIGSFEAGVLNQGLRYAADQRVVATTITAGDGKAVRRLTYLHPVLADTPLGCRMVEVDRLVDTFTMARPGQRVDGAAAELANDREQMYHWLGLLGLAEAVSARPAHACPVGEVQRVVERRQLGPLKFSPRMNKAVESFVNEQKLKSAGRSDLIQRAQKCAAVESAEIGNCLCKQVAPGGLPAHYWFPEDHTSQVREKKAKVDASMAWLKPSSDRLGHFDFWTHTTFALRNGQTGNSDENSTAALDFPPEQLSVLRAVVAASLPGYVQLHLRSQSVQDFMGPLEEFLLTQRLARAALGGQLGTGFPLSRLIELEKQTRRFVPVQPTIRWEGVGTDPELAETLKKADPSAADRFLAYQADQLQRMLTRAPLCSAASN